MRTGCRFTERTGTGAEPTVNDCQECAMKYELPYAMCCLDECGEHYICIGCTKGIHKKGEKENGD